MLEKSDTSVGEVLTLFNETGLDVGLLVPTPTGLKKSIMDATATFRDFLLDAKIHDFSTQAQGQEHKVVVPARMVFAKGSKPTKVSLYRPTTKKGDPRICVYGLKAHAVPFNLLALFNWDGLLHVVNCSDPEILRSIKDPGSPLGSIAQAARPGLSAEAGELLDLLREIGARGWIPTMRSGDTGIGMTLETLLGIEANSSKLPDFKGIEIKAKRAGRKRKNRVNLFSQVPNWKLSPLGSNKALLDAHGYEVDGRRQLYCTISGKMANPNGFVLSIDGEKDWLRQNHVVAERTTRMAVWELAKLRDRLTSKHRQTFWVSAETRGKGASEEFHYVQVEHTRAPRVRNFEALVEAGVITLDYTLYQREKGGSVGDHGYLFKVNPKDFNALFPPSEYHGLVA